MCIFCDSFSFQWYLLCCAELTIVHINLPIISPWVLQELLRLLFKSFVNVLTERLPPVSADGDVPNLRAGDPNVTIPVSDPEAATMEIDNENGADNNRSVLFYIESLYYFVSTTSFRITVFCKFGFTFWRITQFIVQGLL
jgi:hypothetical protein